MRHKISLCRSAKKMILGGFVEMGIAVLGLSIGVHYGIHSLIADPNADFNPLAGAITFFLMLGILMIVGGLTVILSIVTTNQLKADSFSAVFEDDPRYQDTRPSQDAVNFHIELQRLSALASFKQQAEKQAWVKENLKDASPKLIIEELVELSKNAKLEKSNYWHRVACAKEWGYRTPRSIRHSAMNL